MSEELTQNLPNDDLKRILARLDSIDAGLVDMNTRLEKLGARAYDTKPIWENALKEITDVRVEMREGFEKSRSETETGLRRLEHKIDILNKNILDVRADQRELEERVNKLDSQPAQ
jgi:chromosome segregation ATPase